jgi:hypothetical protein
MKRSNFHADHRLLTLINRFVIAFLPRSFFLRHARHATQNGAGKSRAVSNR